MPAVALGQLHPSITQLAQIDRDQYQIGHILTDYLLRQRCSRLLVLLRDTVTCGDHCFLDAIMATCSEAKWETDRVRIRCFPADADAVQAGVATALTRRKTGLLCRNEQLAEAAIAGAAQSAGSTNCLAAVADVYRSKTPRFASAAAVIPPEEFGRQTGRVLLESTGPDDVAPARTLIPVELKLPTDG